MGAEKTSRGYQAESIAQAVGLLAKAQALLDAERLSVAAAYVQMAIDLCVPSAVSPETPAKAMD